MNHRAPLFRYGGGVGRFVVSAGEAGSQSGDSGSARESGGRIMRRSTQPSGGSMRRRITAITVLLAASLALAGCSSSGGHDDKPTPTVTVTKKPKLSAAEQRKACVSAWAEVLHGNADADQELDEPAECAGVSGDHYGMYVDGMMQRNQENRDAARECLDDPSCTELPVP